MRHWIAPLFLAVGCPAIAQDVLVETVVVTADDEANLRSDGEVIARVRRGSVLTVFESNNVAYRVYWKLKDGWIGKEEVVPLDEAEEYFTEAIRRNPNAENYNIRGMLWDQLIYSSYLSDDPDSFEDVITYIDNAINDFTEAIRLDSEVASYFFNRGAKLASAEKYELAIDDYSEALRLDKEYASAVYEYRGNAWSRLGHHDKAIADFTELIRLKPDDADAYSDRAHARYETGELDNSIADYNESLRLNARDPHSYVFRGLAFQAKGDFDKAIDDFTEAIRLDPEDGVPHYHRGEARRATGEYDNALDDYNEAVRLTPWMSGFHNKLAWLLATCPDETFRDGQQAVEHATKACESRDWEEPHFLNTFAAACAEAGDFERAVEWQKMAIELCEADENEDYRARLRLYESGMPYRDEIAE